MSIQANFKIKCNVIVRRLKCKKKWRKVTFLEVTNYFQECVKTFTVYCKNLDKRLDFFWNWGSLTFGIVRVCQKNPNFRISKPLSKIAILKYSRLRNKHRGTLINFWKKKWRKKNEKWPQCLVWCKNELKFWC